MKRKFYFALIGIFTLLAINSCSEESDPNTLSVSQVSISGNSEATDYTISINSTTSWTATSSEDWCSISPSSGTGNGSVVISVSENADINARTAIISISNGQEEKSITLTQAGKEPIIGTVTMVTAKTEVTFYVSALNATVNWGDGSSDTYEGNDVPCSHIYTTTETHTITIVGSSFYSLDCSFNEITTLDVSENEELTILECYTNNLTQLDVSDNLKLRQLSAAYNDITSLDVTQNTALEVLEFRNNDLTSIDLSQNTALTVLEISDNPQLISLDISNNTSLLSLIIYIGSISSLDLSQNTALINLNIQIISNLTSLDLSENIHLRNLTCEQTSITSLDLSNNPEIVQVKCRLNNFTSLNFCSTSTALTNISCGFNSLSNDALNATLTSLPTITGTHPATMTLLPYNDGSGLPYWEELDDRMETSPEIYEIKMYDIFIGTSVCDESIATNKGWTVSASN